VLKNIQKTEPMKKPVTSAQITDRLFKLMHEGKIEKADLVQIFEHTASILNARTLSNYARDNGISYNGAKLQKEMAVINGIKFIIQ
jgi:hypothetical protein